MDSTLEFAGDEPSDEQLMRTLIAIGLVAGDLNAAEIARFAKVHPSVAAEALARAKRSGIVDREGRVNEDETRRLVGELSARRVAEVHADAARAYLAVGSGRIADGVGHARAAGPLIAPGEIIAQARDVGFLCLTLNDWASAELLFRLAIDLSPLADESSNTLQLRFHAVALNAMGRMSEGLDVLLHAAEIAIAKGDWREATSVLVQMAIPTEWAYGNKIVAGLLDRVDRMELNDETRLVLDSVRAMVEAWIPLEVVGDQQFAWVSRASLAQPITERVLSSAVGVERETRLVALMAWRDTHRAPRFLSQRRIVSTEAVDLAQLLRFGYFQIESAIALGVDALESGDRQGYDSAIAVVRWVAEQEGSQWLRWRALTVSAGQSLFDGDLARARRLREQAHRIGEEFNLPGHVAANTFLLVGEILSRDDLAEMEAFVVSSDEPAVAHPLGRLALAFREVRVGRDENAERLLRLALRQHDDEASFLLVASRAAQVAVLLSESGQVPIADVVEQLIDLLEPWSSHVAVDGFGLWCDGPVALRLAELYVASGREDRARVMLHFAEPIVERIHHARSRFRVAELRQRLGSEVDVVTSAGFDLSERQLRVLRGIVEGKTNQVIAAEMVFSLSTVRAEASEIFRKLGVTGRREAAFKAQELGLIDLDGP